MADNFADAVFYFLSMFEQDVTKSGWILKSEIDDAEGEFTIESMEILQGGEIIDANSFLDIAKDKEALCSQRHIEAILRKQEGISSVKERKALLPAECQHCCSVATGTVYVDSKNRFFMPCILWGAVKWEMCFYCVKIGFSRYFRLLKACKPKKRQSPV